jgi:hypothetical protein
MLTGRRRMGAGTRRRPGHAERRFWGAERAAGVADLGEDATGYNLQRNCKNARCVPGVTLPSRPLTVVMLVSAGEPR